MDMNMTAENQDFLHLIDAISELNVKRLRENPEAACYAPSTAYGYARSGQIPTKRKGRAYFVHRADIPLIAKKLPLGTRRSSPSAA